MQTPDFENRLPSQRPLVSSLQPSFVGASPAMNRVFEMIKLVGPVDANVLIQGESGTGKELVAHALHREGSRKNHPFIPINCTAIPEQLLESELFGYAKGSFTGAIGNKRGLFEEADGGTLFLDEIGDMSLDLQSKLLRVLQDRTIRSVGSNTYKTINVRIVAATHRDLASHSKGGHFREDLFYRLNVIPIRVPPLRDRKEDIPLLVHHFVHRFAKKNCIVPQQVSVEALGVLQNHSWPGNVRELENVIERALILSQGGTIKPEAIICNSPGEESPLVSQLPCGQPTLEQLEEHYIKMIMQQVHFKKDQAAQILGISRRTLYRKEKLYGISPTDS